MTVLVREPTTMERLAQIERLVKRHGDRAYRMAMGITGNRQAAEEVVQDALSTVLRKTDTGHAGGAVDVWVDRIVMTLASRKLHREPGQPADIPLDGVLPPFREDGRHAGAILDWSARVGDAPLGADLRRVLMEAIDELPSHYRSVLLLRDVEGLSEAEAGQALGVAGATVRSRVHRARLFLQKRLALHFSTRRVD